MDLNQVLTALQYDTSPNFSSSEALEADRDFGHVFRRARADCRLHGAYVPNAPAYDSSQGAVPVVYVCEAESEGEAREIHRKVWNQNAVPFLLTVSPAWVRLYPGFKYDRIVARDPLQGALEVIEDFSEIARRLSPPAHNPWIQIWFGNGREPQLRRKRESIGNYWIFVTWTNRCKKTE